jgi:hypothetical protein
VTDNIPEYNGYANYPTWVTMLWIDNDADSYNESRCIVREAYEECEPPADLPDDMQVGYRRSVAADVLKEWATNEPEMNEGAGLAADLLGFALGLVDWRELACLLKEEQ